MKIKPKISILISAFNEGKNIANLINDIFSQDQEKWDLREILVSSDGSTDNTVSELEKFNNKKLVILNGKHREGKTPRLAQMFKKAQGDIFILFDGDIKLEDKKVIEELIKQINVIDKVVLVGGNTRPQKPVSFFQRSVYSTFFVFDYSRKNFKNGHNVFGCTGACIAIEKNFAKQIKFKNVINDDDFLYFSCLSNNYQFRYAKDAVVRYKLPTNLSDYLRQIYRSNPEAAKISLTKYFGELVTKEYDRSHVFYLKGILQAFIKYPLPTLYIAFVNLLAKPFYPLISNRYKLNWHTAQSTK